ncbi:MAG: hypothetical protein LUC85_01895 [Bacteroidales bacterium]|nr:hypothetical protein [Bacteroidales bacterium]MCD8393570.1 hypothetical protein [Bacteroidales bacterium]
MITKKVIQSIYKKYRRRPESVDDLNIGLLFERSLEPHHITIHDGAIVIGTIEPLSPFHEIPLDRVHAIVEFDRHVAIVLHSSIIFLKKHSEAVSVDIKMPKLTLFDRLRLAFAK